MKDSSLNTLEWHPSTKNDKRGGVIARGFGGGAGLFVTVGIEGVADGVEAMVVELYGVIEEVSVFILRI